MRRWKMGLMGLTALSLTVSMTSQTFASSEKTVSNLGVMDVESMSFMANFNPFSPNKLGGASFMYEPLLIINGLNSDVTPWLATKYAWSKDGRKLTLTIRQGVKWSDGVPFTANDVAYTYNLLKKDPALDQNGLWGILKDVSAKGNTVTMTLKQPNYLMFSELVQVPIVPQHIWSKVKNPVTWPDSSPVVTGPYTLKSSNSSEYILQKNPNYWQKGKPLVDSLTFYAISTNQAAELALLSGKLDWTSIFLQNLKGVFASRDVAHNKYWLPPGSPNSLYLNLSQYPFNIVKFRQALAYAINKQTIDVKGEGGYEPPASATDIILPYDSKYLNKAVDKKYQYGYNPSLAKATLKSAGFSWNKQGRLLDPKGKAVSFTIEIPSGWTDYVQDSQIISQELKRLGITVKVYTPSVSTYYSDMGNGTYQAAIQSPNIGSDPGLLFYNTFDSSMSAPIGKPASSNYERWNNKTTDKLISEYAKAANVSAQKKILFKLEAQVAQNLPIIPLNYSPAFVEYKTNKVVGWPDDSNPYANAAPWSGTNVLLVVTRLRSAT